MLNPENPVVVTYYQSLKAEVRFLDSEKPDKYGPRGF